MNEIIYFVVYGEPKPEARHRTRVVQTKEGRTFASQYQPKENRQNRAYLRQAATHASAELNGALLDGPIELTVVCWLEQPKSKRVTSVVRSTMVRLLERLFPAGKPDCDNLVKPIKDALTSVLWTDDARVVSEHVHKRYTTGRPCTEVWVRVMRATEAFDPLVHSRADNARPTDCVLPLPEVAAVAQMEASLL